MRKIATRIQSAPPVALGPPAIYGMEQIGSTLFAMPGSYTRPPRNYAYQWQNEGSNIAGATSATYVPQASDLGALITVKANAVNGAGSSIPAIAFLASQIKIMPLGDSLTYGTDGNPPHAGIPGGYRASLWTTLQNDGYNIAYVGSQTGNPDPGVLPFSNHEGHGGYTINVPGTASSIKIGIDTLNWLAVQPDIILLDIGINDLFNGRTTAQANTDYGLLLDDILNILPNVKVICATLIQLPGAWVSTFNANLAAMVIAKGPRVFLADMAAASVPYGADGVHPNASGYNQMAAVWESAVKAAWPLALSPVLGTTVRYVSNSIGNDSWDGTAPAFVSGTTGPWKTIAHVNAQTFAPGTSVLFKRGDTWDRSAGPTVTGTFLPTGGGTSGNPIVYDAYGTGANPIIDGSADASTTGAWTNIGTNLWQSVQTFPPITDVTITFTGSSGNPLTVNGWFFTPYANGSVIFANTGGALPTGLTAGTVYYILSPSGSTFEISATPGGTRINVTGTLGTGTTTAGVSGFPYNNANDVGNILWGFSALGGSAPAGVMSASFGTMVGAGIGGVWYLPGEGTTTLAGASQGSWNFNTDNFRVQVHSVGNPATAMRGLRLAMDGAFIIFQSSNSNIAFQNLTFQNTAYSSAITPRASNVIIRDCVIQWVGGGNIGGASSAHSRGGDGINPEGSYSNILIERNYFYQMYDLGISPQEPSGGPHDNLTIRNNIFHQCGKVFGTGLAPNSVGSTQNLLYIYNNTAYGVASWSANQRPDGGPAVYGIVFGPYDSTITVSNTFVENNTMTAIGDFYLLVKNSSSFPLTLSLSTIGATWDYNNWNQITPLSYQVGQTGPGAGNFTMTSWVSDYGFDAHGLINIDPSFTNPGSANFTPTSSSPLRNAGKNLCDAGVVWDFNHNPRPASGPFTMGAFQ